MTLADAERAIAAAEAAGIPLQVRGELFGSAGMLQEGSPAHLTTSLWTVDGVSAPTARRDTDPFADAYAAELAVFCTAVRTGNPTTVGGHDARAALRIALACIEAVETGTTVTIRDKDREVVA